MMNHKRIAQMKQEPTVPDNQLFALLATLTPLPPPATDSPREAHPSKRQRTTLHHHQPNHSLQGTSADTSALNPSLANRQDVHRPEQQQLPAPPLADHQHTLSTLSTLQKMTQNPEFLDKIQQVLTFTPRNSCLKHLMKDDQDQFELRAIDERNRIKAELDRALKKLTSSDPATRDTNRARIESSYASKLKACDRKVLSQWDQLREQQRLALQKVKFPAA
ncbi:hypothetical protein VP01_1554g3 [Puccinia sorghi]|uniref:Uncharacterized protein n=1 Tax=Puccinia sorghi TaxID=27349 RepID=A0A0L6VIA1_9BASI|nr:hypothetical protein VP01_1554g3 [Puccinia sorghi]